MNQQRRRSLGRNTTAFGFLAIAVLATLLACKASEQNAKPRAPLARGNNLLLITMDTTRADYLSWLGGRPHTSPNLDALAKRSALFANAFSETNITNPSHITLFTGLRAIEHHVFSNEDLTPLEPQMLAEALKSAGYDTAGFAAVRHLARVAGRGFREFPFTKDEFTGTQVTDRALAWLDKNPKKPFFLWVHYYDPHVLYNPPPADAKAFYRGDKTAGNGPLISDARYFRLQSSPLVLITWLGETRDPEYPRAMYAAEIHYMDREIGRLLAEFDRRGLRENTVIIALGDHGESLGEHEIYYGHQGLYEQQLHIPLIIHVPGLPPGRSTHLVSTLDIAPTITDLFGLPMFNQFSGRSLVPLLHRNEDPSPPWRTSFVHQHAHNHAVAIREGEWKLIWPINKHYPLFKEGPLLFNLRQDPGEHVNFAKEQPARVLAMKKRLEPWIRLGVNPSQKAKLDDESMRQLRALGYIED